MKLFALDLHNNQDPWADAPAWGLELRSMLGIIIERLDTMATTAQLDKFLADVQALIAASVAEITAAVAAAQNASPDPAIDTADAAVTAATDKLTAAAAALTPPAA